MADYSPEKAGVGGSTPSLATIPLNKFRGSAFCKPCEISARRTPLAQAIATR